MTHALSHSHPLRRSILALACCSILALCASACSSGAQKKDDEAVKTTELPGADSKEMQPGEVEAPQTEALGGPEMMGQEDGIARSEEPPKEVVVDASLNAEIQRAISEARNGNQAAAINQLENLSDRPDGGFLASYNLGLLHAGQGAYDKAAKAYVKALQKNPDFSPALVNLSRLYLRGRRTDDARQIVDRYVDLRPRNDGHRVAQLDVLAAQGKYEDVIANGQGLLRKDDKNVSAMVAMASANYMLGRHELAQVILNRAAELAPTRGDVFYLAGLIALRLEDKPTALVNFKKAVENQPEFAEARNNLGVLMHEARDYDNAIVQYRAALESWPDFKQAFLNLGNAQKGKGEFKGAEESFKKALSIDKSYADAHFNLALLYLEADMPGMDKIQKWEKAIEVLGQYKEVAKGVKDDPADKYIKEAKKMISDEKARQEMMREAPAEAPSQGDADS